MRSNDKVTITEVARIIGVVPKTLLRWEKAGKIKAPKRNWRGWRVYTPKEIEKIKGFYQSLY